MILALDNCSDGLEQSLFWILFAFMLVLFLSAFMVFTNEEESGSSTWRTLPYFFVWPIYPFFTSEGLNARGKRWRIPYGVSLTAVVVFALIMFITGYCSAKI
ncbi:hypothetical protein MIB92_14985 [Aestuariirhabdus sp. Z084]|uniref:hypothetical protein n=1 Tax=Aestuariirhabdus haliotis TaxID=2918751 RepID=UPI00201B40CC|nr:hypothetical protein [Aestuariirhabdus haliotis]MCL6416964.1 hypothetical protein [Aestuariirhabdus haliotis]MCL6421029.1 hypothetical protein [Aestuariirhabdus haliotis]